MTARPRGASSEQPSQRPDDAEPPAGSPWDEQIERAPLVFLDLEMTGLRPETDRVIEICAERVKGDELVASLASLVRPESGAFGNAHVHGIDPRELDTAPTFAELCDRVEQVMEGAIVVAHAAAWDVAFIEAELARARRPRRVLHYLDTLVLSRRAFALPSHSLASLCSALGVHRERAHRAEDDVHALRRVFRKIVEVLAPSTPRDLWHVRIGERHARPALVAAALRAAEQDEPVRMRYRPARRGPEDLLVRVTGVRTDLDPPRVLGYLPPSRSRRELRADRILAIEPLEPGEPGQDGTARRA
jgi:DNA polymerase III subunit epsilon